MHYSIYFAYYLRISHFWVHLNIEVVHSFHYLDSSGQPLYPTLTLTRCHHIAAAMAQVLARGTIFYLGSVNVGSVALFGYDKMQAKRGEQRVSEKALCRSATFGGWAGGLLAMQLFRHKTRKKVRSALRFVQPLIINTTQSFQQKYVAAIGQNFASMGLAMILLTRSPQVRAAFSRELSNVGRGVGGMFSGGGRGRGGGGRARRR